MKSKKIISLLCAVSLTMAMLAGCGGNSGSGGNGGNNGGGSNGGGTTKVDTSKTLTLEIFDVAANYNGVQGGWFGKAVKDKFNLELNIISGQGTGEQQYATRAASGDLGDILILESGQFQDCVNNGLVKDLTADIYNYSNLKTFQQQIDALNNGLPGNDGKLYGIPTEMMNTSPTSYSQDVIYSSPLLRWDLYSELGCPDIKDLNGLLDVLAQMMEKHPTNEAGDPCYAASLWPDWDGGDDMIGIANVVQLTTWYGEKIKQSLILKPDGTFIPLTDKSGSYYKILKFWNDAYNRGLIDPNSASQTWNEACAKMTAGQVYLMWYSWQVGFWNSTERLQNGTAFIFTPIADQKYYAEADSYFGSGRVFAIGSQVTDEEYARIMEFLDWYASPEGAMLQHDGIEGFNYEKGSDGRYVQMNDNALMDNLPVPAEWGGGGYNDGNNQINQWIVSANSINPLTNEPYAKQYWATYKEATMTDMKKAWQKKFGAEEPAEYMKKNNILIISPNVSVALPTDTNDIGLIRGQCKDAVNTYSWRMIYAKTAEEFDQLWNTMTDKLYGYGFEELMQFDREKYTIELNANNAVK
ncbi:MAG: ABC transporter substrate-binding protein [Lachnospiraceae bacterium]|nr:ABC transporter substrate-binding protein [Lachnospiraceae bacterium]